MHLSVLYITADKGEDRSFIYSNPSHCCSLFGYLVTGREAGCSSRRQAVSSLTPRCRPEVVNYCAKLKKTWRDWCLLTHRSADKYLGDGPHGCHSCRGRDEAPPVVTFGFPAGLEQSGGGRLSSPESCQKPPSDQEPLTF